MGPDKLVVNVKIILVRDIPYLPSRRVSESHGILSHLFHLSPFPTLSLRGGFGPSIPWTEFIRKSDKELTKILLIVYKCIAISKITKMHNFRKRHF